MSETWNGFVSRMRGLTASEDRAWFVRYVFATRVFGVEMIATQKLTFYITPGSEWPIAASSLDRLVM